MKLRRAHPCWNPLLVRTSCIDVRITMASLLLPVLERDPEHRCVFNAFSSQLLSSSLGLDMIEPSKSQIPACCITVCKDEEFESQLFYFSVQCSVNHYTDMMGHL